MPGRSTLRCTADDELDGFAADRRCTPSDSEMVVGSLPIAVMDPPSELIRIDCQGNLPSDRDELRCYSTRDTGRPVQDSGCGADFADT